MGRIGIIGAASCAFAVAVVAPGCGSNDVANGAAQTDSGAPDAGEGTGGASTGGTRATGGSRATGGRSIGGNGNAGAVGADGSVGGTGGATGCIDPAHFPGPPAAQLDVASSCSAITACGGALDGTNLVLESWCLTEQGLLDQVYGICPIVSIGSTTVNSASGSVAFSNNDVKLALHAETTTSITFPNSCTFGRCTDLETNLAAARLFANCGSDGSGGCFCSVERFFDVKDESTYTVSGSTVTTANGHQFDYCVAASGVTLGDKTGSLGSAVFVKATATPERCDGLDNDLNGRVDDDPKDCPPCNAVGVCAEFSATCEATGWTCAYTSPSYQSNETACDGKDNDCDGTVDEPSPEVCNGSDDNCDGRKDEDPEASADCVARNGAGYICQGGVCTCPNVCNGTCADIATDVANCGGCGKACTPGASCVNGGCQCPQSEPTDCTTKCADLTTDAKNCGKCGTACTVACGTSACIDVVDIEMLDFTICALMNNGTIRCWGNGGGGALGNGNTSYTATPVTVSGVTTAAGLAAGARCAWLKNGTAVCWGGNSFGEVGDGTTMERDRPVPVTGLTSVAGIAAESQFICAWTTAGAAYCWGDGTSGQIGDPAAGSEPHTPHLIPTLTSVTQMAVGLQHACALKGGTVSSWGSNLSGQLGRSGAGGTPATIPGLTGVAQISLGALHSCARLTGGTVQCWGSNGNGELGDGSGLNHASPTPIPGLTGVVQIAAGGEHTCAIVTGGAVQCWGWNQMGEIGDGTTDNALGPKPVVGVTNAKKIIAGGESTCVLLTTGEVKCWGSNVFGQCGTGAGPASTCAPTSIVW